jgi:hypothetical protein
MKPVPWFRVKAAVEGVDLEAAAGVSAAVAGLAAKTELEF